MKELAYDVGTRIIPILQLRKLNIESSGVCPQPHYSKSDSGTRPPSWFPNRSILWPCFVTWRNRNTWKSGMEKGLCVHMRLCVNAPSPLSSGLSIHDLGDG